jgi:hypothetical protein
MKKILNILLVAIAFMVVGTSCQKEGLALEKPFVDINFFGKGAYITLNKTVNVNFNYAAISTSKVSVMVDPYNNGVKIKQVKLYVVKSANADPTAWKLVKTVDVNGTTELSATGAEVATAIGTPAATLFAPGQFYTFYNQVVTEDGRTFDLSNTLGALENASGYNACFRWTAYVVCPFTGGMAGKYKVIADGWEDWPLGAIVNVADGPGANQVDLSGVYPGGGYVKNKLVVNVDPATGAASIPRVDYGSYSPTGAVYSAAAANAGYIFSCTGYIGLKMEHFYGTSSYGFYSLILQKQ